MFNPTLQTRRKACFSVMAGLILCLYSDHLNGQQEIVNKKDVTRTETSRQYNSFNLASVKALEQNTFNETKWPASTHQAAKKIVIEYSFDGINFISGPQILSAEAMITYQHALQDTKPILYRLRTEEGTGAINYSGAFLPKGFTISPVQIQNNMVHGNVINVTAQFPVEKVLVVSGDGVQQFSRDINGLRDFIPLTIPTLNRGLYFITFYGNGWNSTSRFMVI